jgi:hypothetical protein
MLIQVQVQVQAQAQAQARGQVQYTRVGIKYTRVYRHRVLRTVVRTRHIARLHEGGKAHAAGWRIKFCWVGPAYRIEGARCNGPPRLLEVTEHLVRQLTWEGSNESAPGPLPTQSVVGHYYCGMPRTRQRCLSTQLVLRAWDLLIILACFDFDSIVYAQNVGIEMSTTYLHLPDIRASSPQVQASLVDPRR